MKQRITVENLLELSSSQKDRLNSMWIPDIYDLTVAYVCRDAEKELYDLVKFVIGDIIVEESYGRRFVNITLRNIKSMTDVNDKECEDESQYNDEEYEAQESDFNPENVALDFINKSDCMPLLNLGQMMKILGEQGYGDGSFYIDINSDKENCGIGRVITQFQSYGRDFEEPEICDALWSAVKAIL